ncbi:hypothetical protein SUGI_1075990 [Cryptomeria japonica]|nr:hypothetical protein SUGI_1075990 [Cryptomeria japonica]
MASALVKLTEIGNVGHHAELQIINVVAHVIGDGGDEAGLARTRRTVQKITSLPCAARPAVELSALQKIVEVPQDLVFKRGFEGQGIEGGRMPEGR